MAFVSLWEGFKWPDGTVTRAFTIATTHANGTVGALHGRMSVILEPPADVVGRGCERGTRAGDKPDSPTEQPGRIAPSWRFAVVTLSMPAIPTTSLRPSL